MFTCPATAKFSDLIGHTILDIKGAEKGSDSITFEMSNGGRYVMQHHQDCCESVDVDDVVGDVADLIGSPVLRAEVRNEDGSKTEREAGWGKYTPDSATWTFYELATIKGSVTLRWFGESNGYYSEEVSFDCVKTPDSPRYEPS